MSAVGAIARARCSARWGYRGGNQRVSTWQLETMPSLARCVALRLLKARVVSVPVPTPGPGSKFHRAFFLKSLEVHHFPLDPGKSRQNKQNEVQRRAAPRCPTVAVVWEETDKPPPHKERKSTFSWRWW